MLYDEDFWTEHIVTSEKRTENTKESLRFYLFEHSLSKKKEGTIILVFLFR